MSEQTKQPDTMRDLLTRWAAMEPDWCRLNLNWQPANGDNNYYIATQTDDSEGWQLVYGDAEPNCYFPGKNEALGRIQYAVQAAIVARGWYVQSRYVPRQKQWIASVGFTYDQVGDSPAEVILSAYLKEIEENSK